MARVIRTAGLALVAAVMGAAGVSGTLDPGGEQAAQPPSAKPPSTSVAVRATSTPAAVPDAAPPQVVPRLAAAAVPFLGGVEEAAAPDPGPAPAEIATIEADQAPGWQDRVGAAALARLDYPVDAIGYRIEFLPARAGYLGMTFPERRLIEIYVRDGLTVDDVARNTAHELGHAFDFTFNTAATRALYKQLRGIAGAGWLACRGCTDLATPAGDFAETFSFWLMDGAFPSRSRLGDAPDAAQLRLLAPLFRPPAA